MEIESRKIVTKIEANPMLSIEKNSYKILRVAAYCRVSTDTEDQIESYKAQVKYYTDLIYKNPSWQFVNIYADEGISGTQAKSRVNFLKMIKDCEKGKIDLILTKSVARFARNTVDSLKYVRKLKAKGIGIFFEEQNINTLNIDSEMFIGFYSVLAQAESENISANVRWGIQQRMKAGTYAFRYNILGYKKGANGEPEIVEKEAEIIRKIYQMYLDGKSVDQIKEYLESNHYSTTRGKEIWSKSVILRILTNERYCGEMLLQKTYTENCISKKKKINHGEMAKYLIKNSHKPIIDKSIFKAVQLEIAKRCTKKKTIMNGLTKKSKYSGKYALTDLLVCGECGSCYRRKSWTRNNKKKIVWRCLNRIKYGAKICKHSISIEDEELKQIIIRSINKVIDEKEEIVSMITNNLSYEISKDDCFLNVYAIENQINELNKLRDDTISMRINTKGDKKRYDEEIKNLTLQIVSLRDELEIEREKSKEKKEINIEIEKIKEFLMDDNHYLLTYNDDMIRRIVSYIKVMKNSIVIVLKGGYEIEEEII